jgi:heme oxygenase
MAGSSAGLILDIFQQLRTSTRAIHSGLEDDLNLLRRELRLGEYKRLLERFYGFYVVWEPQIQVGLAQLPGLELDRRKKVPLLRDDLTYLGDNLARLSGLPRCTSFPDLSSRGRLLGSLYVIEGSTLGGRILAHHFETTLRLHAGAGASFFASYQDQLGFMWNRFRSVLIDNTDSENQQDILGGARQTFECMHDWMCMRKAAVA